VLVVCVVASCAQAGCAAPTVNAIAETPQALNNRAQRADPCVKPLILNPPI
jgi:hypothetical protein